MTDQPPHDGADLTPIPGPWTPAKGDLVELTHVERAIVHIRPGQRGTVTDTYEDAVLVEMMVLVRKAVPASRLDPIGDKS